MRTISITYATARPRTTSFFVRSGGVLVSGNSIGYEPYPTARDAWMAAVDHAQLDRKRTLEVVTGTHDQSSDGYGARNLEVEGKVLTIEFTHEAFEALHLESLRLGVNAHEVASAMLESHYSEDETHYRFVGTVTEEAADAFRSRVES